MNEVVPDGSDLFHEDVVRELVNINDTIDTMASIDEELTDEVEYNKAYDLLSVGYDKRRKIAPLLEQYLIDIGKFIIDYKGSVDPKVTVKVLAAQDFLRDKRIISDKQGVE